jgi:hypothetical protein
MSTGDIPHPVPPATLPDSPADRPRAPIGDDAPANPPVDLGPIGPKARYEFTKDQEAVIGDLASKMRFVGLFMLAMSLVAIVQVGQWAYRTKYFDWGSALSALLSGVIGVWTVQASGGFAAVVETTGWDVPHLMDALSSLRKMYSLMAWLTVMILAALVILVIANIAR